MYRRTFLAASAAAPFASILTPKRGRVGADHARRIRARVPELYGLDDAHGGLGVRDAAAGCLRRVDALLNDADYDTATGTELQVAYGELAEMTGWLCFDAGEYGSARSYLGEALRAAQLAEDHPLEVLVLASMNTLARYQERPREAIALIHLAQRRAQGWGTPRLLALLFAREAVCHAQLRDSSASARSMSHAHNTFAPEVRDDDPAWIGFFDRAELEARCSTAFSYLGKHERSAAFMGSAVGHLAPEFQRNRAYYSVRQGLLLAKTGDMAAACAAVKPVLGLYAEVRSGRAVTRLHEFLAVARASRTRDSTAFVEYADTLPLPTV